MTALSRAPQEDQERLRGQCRRIMAFYVSHPGYWTLEEVSRGIGAASEAGVSARLRQLTGEGYGWAKDKRKRARNLWEYRMTPPGEKPQLELL